MKKKKRKKKTINPIAYCALYFCPKNCIHLNKDFCILYNTFLKTKPGQKFLERCAICNIQEMEDLLDLSHFTDEERLRVIYEMERILEEKK